MLQGCLFQRQANSRQPYIFKMLIEKHCTDMKEYFYEVYNWVKRARSWETGTGAALRSSTILDRLLYLSLPISVKLR